MFLPRRDRFFIDNKPVRVSRTINLRVSLADIRAILRWNFQAQRTGFITRLIRANPNCFKCGQALGSLPKNVHHIRALATWADDVFTGDLSLEDAKSQCNCVENLRLMHKSCHESMEKINTNTF